MARYRKRPVVVEAEQWWPGRAVVGVRFDREYSVEDLDGGRIVCEGAHVVTIHGQKAYLAPGDFVITEPDGVHHYPCKPTIFASAYEPVQPPKPPDIDHDRPCCECGESYVCNPDDPKDCPVWCPKCRLLPHCQPKR